LINEDLQKLRQDSQYTGSTVLNDDSFWIEDFDACSRQPVCHHRRVVWDKKKARQCKDHYTSGTERRKTKT